MDAAKLLASRQEKDQFFRSHPQSPLTPEQQKAFNALRYYDPNPALEFTLRIDPIADGKFVQIQTTTGDIRMMKRYGHFTFPVEGQETTLTLYEADYGFFLPFVDANAGQETYPAGRYLEPEYLGDNRFHIDFNQAYNPYCAYGEPQSLAVAAGREPIVWSCPITPPENRLQVAIQAGEMLPIGDWVAHE